MHKSIINDRLPTVEIVQGNKTNVSAIETHKGYQFYALIAHFYFDSSNTLKAWLPIKLKPFLYVTVRWFRCKHSLNLFVSHTILLKKNKPSTDDYTNVVLFHTE